MNFSAMPSKQQNPLNPKKLLLSKWTAVKPSHKRKHFLVSKVILPELPDAAIEFIELEAVFDKSTQVIPWRDLKETDIWLQGWV
ncbi:TIGR02450 family Trp-rich protein [Polynucleobacter sp. AP-Ainpum-60-G11]|uniref:TIGR02450 family Trp-rich protein n=1 Tax=Polynucleobacter sp. AP-Ainpum-60-G11 TaxID=2576926 RepID=UPI00203D22E8|nr:TIGR02450 family Trp-rich protein [Polynucleobacter sp. AP-Ainpum-60-G11]